MKDMDRREFIRTVTIGGALISLGKAVFPSPVAAEASRKVDIGMCKGLTITCISETGWWNTKKVVNDMQVGYMFNDQWAGEYDPENSAGVCSLIDMEALDGTHHKFLLDTGWNAAYMKRRFQETSVNRMLENGEIDFLYISHEHFDHLWGLETTLVYRPDIKIIVPSTFGKNAFHLIGGAEFKTPGVSNKIRHKGKLVKCSPGGIHKLLPGCASVTFPVNIPLGIWGEHSLYFNVKDKGIVCVTGCCHQGILKCADYAEKHILGSDKFYGIYGGLHIQPFERHFGSEEKKVTQGMAKYGFRKIAVNHCTGLSAVKMMIELGYPVVKGTKRFGSKSDLYIGNGDVVEF